jgi:hypothetical protein
MMVAAAMLSLETQKLVKRDPMLRWGDEENEKEC